MTRRWIPLNSAQSTYISEAVMLHLVSKRDFFCLLVYIKQNESETVHYLYAATAAVVG